MSHCCRPPEPKPLRNFFAQDLANFNNRIAVVETHVDQVVLMTFTEKPSSDGHNCIDIFFPIDLHDYFYISHVKLTAGSELLVDPVKIITLQNNLEDLLRIQISNQRANNPELKIVQVTLFFGINLIDPIPNQVKTIEICWTHHTPTERYVVNSTRHPNHRHHHRITPVPAPLPYMAVIGDELQEILTDLKHNIGCDDKCHGTEL